MYLNPLTIKNLKLTGNIFLAPMAEITDYPFRKICLKYDCDMAISEMVSAKALCYGSKRAMDAIKVRDDRPICLQIFGSDKNSMLNAALLCESFGSDMIEINAGCPVKKITKTGAGSALLKTSSVLFDIVELIASKIKIPLSVKIRTGFNKDDKNAIMISKNLESSGADIIHLHMRTVEQEHTGEADLSFAAEVKSKIKIPLIANGGITNPLQAVECFKKTGCDAISIGRGAISNPFIFTEIKDYIKNGNAKEYSLSGRINAFIEYLEIASSEYGEERALIRARRLGGMWLSKFKNATDVRSQFMKMKKLDDAIKLLSSLL
jgi:tRNA-dihydrouridine synthase B